MISFEEELSQVINRHSAENVSGTPDFLLARFLLENLKTFNDIVTRRAEWRGESCELPALVKAPKVLTEELENAIKKVLDSVKPTDDPMKTLASIGNLKTVYEISNG